jgi:hypothetical protein
MGCCFSKSNELEEPILKMDGVYNQTEDVVSWKEYNTVLHTAKLLRKKYNTNQDVG